MILYMKFRKQELMFIGWIIVLIIVGIWFGTLFLSLDDPKKYGDIFSAVNTSLSTLVAVIGILIGIDRYKNKQMFELAVNSHYSVSLYNKRKMFYESYVNALSKLESWLWVNGIPDRDNEKEFQNIIIDFIRIRKEHERWLSENDLKNVKEIEDKHIAFMAESHHLNILQNEKNLKDYQNQKRIDLIEKASKTIEELFSKGGFERVRNELKVTMGINAIGEMQKFIIDASEKYMRE